MKTVKDLKEAELFIFSQTLELHDVVTGDSIIYDLKDCDTDNVLNAIDDKYINRKVFLIQPYNNTIIISLL